MAQNLVGLFGSAGAARFLQLVGDNYRYPVWKLRAFGPDGTTLLGDVTPYLKTYSATLTDETKADKASFTLDNSDARFDPLAYGPMSQWLVENNVLVMEKGLRDPDTGVDYLLPAFWGIIAENAPTYTPSGEQTVTILCGDALKRSVKQKFTSYPYDNTEVNVIAADLLGAFGKIPAQRIRLAPVSRNYGFVQFPDMSLIDCLKTLYDPLQFSVRADEAGNITTRPRLGSALSVLSNVLGFPDQTTAPPANAVDYVIPDLLVDSIEPKSQDYDGVSNQFRVLGKAAGAQQTLGPSTALFSLGNSSIDGKIKSKPKYAFTNNSSSGQNAVVAKNVFVEINYATNHDLDGSPRTKILSLLNWRGAWAATTNYQAGDAVSHGGSAWACSRDADGAREPGTSGGQDFWDALPVAGPFDHYFSVDNEDPHEVGFISLEAVTPSYVVMKIEGREFSVGHFPTRRHGGFDYNLTIHGQPVLSFNKTLTAYADYNAQTVTGETLSDIFSDHKTFQAAHQPLAMSVPVEVFKDGVSLGTIAADQTDLSGEQAFGVDFERGRIVLSELTYQAFTRDDAASHPLSTGGSAQSTTATFDLSLLDAPGPQALYQTRRDGDSTFVFPALTIGQGYDVRLHFGEPTYGSEGQRVFSVYAQGDKVIDGLDVAKKAGGLYKAYQETMTGIAPDANGKITINVCQNDPISGNRLDESKGPSAFVSGIEILLPQGQGADPFAVNCGGPLLSPTPPTITASYGFSPVQQTYEVQSEEINNPLISTQTEALSVAAFAVNRSMWKRHPVRLSSAAIPHIQPGDLVRCYNPRYDTDFWLYVSQVSPALQAGSKGAGGTDTTSLEAILIYKAAR